MIYRSKPYLEWIRTLPSCAPYSKKMPVGQMVYAHQRISGGNGGTSCKPHDSFALPLTTSEHAAEHRGDKSFWGNTDQHRLIVEHIVKYLDEKHNINGWMVAAVLLTEMMDMEGIK